MTAGFVTLPGQYNCPVCNTEGAYHQHVTHDTEIRLIKCPVCKKYQITETVIAINSIPQNPNKYILAAIIREANEMDQPLITLDSDNVGDYLSEARKPTGFMDKLNRILLYIHKNIKIIGNTVRITPYDYPIAFAINKEEFLCMLRLLKKMDLLNLNHDPTEADWTSEIPVAPSVKGYQKIDELILSNPIYGNLCFVAMSFAPEMDLVWDKGIKLGIEDAGYKPVRIDKVEHNEQITDKIIAEIRQSRIMVADFTGQRQGVYYEAGFARGLNKTVISSCRKDNLKKCHFDTRQYRHIVWTTPDELREKLKNCILATAPLK